MRDLILVAFLAAGLLTTIRYPFAGLLLWAWFTLATPHQAAYAAGQLPLNMVIAAVTFIAFFWHGEFGRVRLTTLSWIILAFTAWLGVSQAASLWPENSAEPADRLLKIMIFVFLCSVTTTSRLRFHALLWVFALVMGFHGAKGGAFTLATLGQGRYEGIPNTILFDNNHMGIALAASLPIFFYLARQSGERLVRWGVWLVIALTVIGIVGTHSRGALLSLLALGGWLWLRSDRKILGAAAAAVLAVSALPLLPTDWTERMETITEADEDASFQGRVDAWVINWELAKAHPVTGAGLRNSYESWISSQVSARTPRAAHSVYFEILGGMGFVGLALYLGMLGYGFLTARRAERQYAEAPGGRWRARFGRQAQASLVVFCVGGASVSLEMWEGYLLVIALVSALARIDLAATTSQAGYEVERVRRRAARRPERPALARQTA